MTADPQRQHPGWDAMCQQQAIETMPWFYPELDDDLRQALEQRGLQSGSALDLGTGPGTQASRSAEGGGERSYDFTALDQVMPHPVY
jgi:methylase of polypeptide subunit release factors